MQRNLAAVDKHKQIAKKAEEKYEDLAIKHDLLKKSYGQTMITVRHIFYKISSLFN